MAHALRFTLAAALLAAVMAGPGAPGALAGPYTRLQVLLPGESAAPGTSTGKTGSPLAQTSGVPFSITVRACDNTWVTVPTVTNVIAILSSDASATLPAPSQLAGGIATFQVRFNAGGTFTLFAHDETDGTIPDGTSANVASLVLQGFEFSRITQKNQYAGQAMTVTLTARDPNGGLVSGFSGAVRLREITSFGDGRTSPETVTLSNGSWTGGVTMYRADESSINRGNVNLYALLDQAPQKNGTSDPFTVHPGNAARVQIVVPGENPLPGSVSGKTGVPATQGAGRTFNASVYATDTWWNPVPSADQVRISSSDQAANTPLTGALTNGFRQFAVSLGTVGTQTLTVTDLTNGSMTAMTSPPITVIPSAVDHFEIATIASPVTAGAGVTVTIRATDANGNTVPNYAGDARLAANTGAGSITPESIAFTAGVWTGSVQFFGAGGAVSFACLDFSAPPTMGTSNTFTVQPGPLAKLQVLLPGESAEGGTADGKTGAPLQQSAGAPFTLVVRAVDAYWNLVTGVNDRVALGSTDQFAAMPAETTLANGQRLLQVSLAKSGPQRIWASDVTNSSVLPDTSSVVNVVGGPFARVLILAPGESPAPGTAGGRTGTATDQSINFAFTCTVLATDQWWNPVGGVTDVVHIASDDPLATLPPDQAMVDGRADVTVRLARGGYNQISVTDVTNPAKTGSATQVRAITSGFHLEAAITPSEARAGEPFTLTVKVTNDAGSVIQEINSFVTLEVQNASTREAGRGTLLTTQFQLLQGQRTVSQTYTFVEPILIIARDDAGNAPATSNAITINPGAPATIQFTSTPPWVGGNKHALLRAHLIDAFDNAVPGEVMVFSHLSGNGTLTQIDSLTNATGDATADFLSVREPSVDRIRASSNGLVADLDLQTAFVDPYAAGGTMTNYPNPFHPPGQGTTLAWKLDDNANVTLRIFTLNGVLVLRQTFDRATPGGAAGLNEWVWDGRNGDGTYVASGAYTALVEAQGTGETIHVIRRRMAVVRWGGPMIPIQKHNLRGAALSVFLSAALLLASPGSGSAQDQTGGAPGEWMLQYRTARTLGMGGAFVANADDPLGVLWNPAGLSAMDQNEVRFEHGRLFEETSLNSIGFAVPGSRFPSLGVLVLSMRSGEIQRTNEMNDDLGTFRDTETAYLLTASRAFTPRFAVGANLKVVQQGVEDFSASGFGVDLGATYDATSTLRIGAAVANLGGPSHALRAVDETYPVVVRAGFAATLLQGRGLFSAQFDQSSDQGLAFHAGGEYWIQPTLAVRAGYDESAASGGFGYRFHPQYQFDYGLTDNTLGLTHRIGLSYRFSGFFASSTSEPQVFSPTGEKAVTRFTLNSRTKSEPREWSLELRNKADEVVRRFGGKGQAPSHIEWDGKDETGMPLPDGAYRYRLVVIDAAGREVSAPEHVVEISTGGPQGQVPVLPVN